MVLFKFWNSMLKILSLFLILNVSRIMAAVEKCAGIDYDIATHDCVVVGMGLRPVEKSKVPDCSKSSSIGTKPIRIADDANGIYGFLYVTPVGTDGAVSLKFESQGRKVRAEYLPSEYSSPSLNIESENGFYSGPGRVDYAVDEMLQGVGINPDHEKATKYKAVLKTEVEKAMSGLKDVSSKCTDYSSADGKNIAKLKSPNEEIGYCRGYKEVTFQKYAQCKCGTGELVNLSSASPQKCPDFNKSSSEKNSTSNTVEIAH
jgi:hypothetical protein